MVKYRTCQMAEKLDFTWVPRICWRWKIDIYEGGGGVINVCSFSFWRRTQSLPHEEEGGWIIWGESGTLDGSKHLWYFWFFIVFFGISDSSCICLAFQILPTFFWYFWFFQYLLGILKISDNLSLAQYLWYLLGHPSHPRKTADAEKRRLIGWLKTRIEKTS